MKKSIRFAKASDIQFFINILNSIDLFPGEYLMDMMSDYLSNDDSNDIWFTKIKNGVPISLGYCVKEKFTHGTYNLYALGVHSDLQGNGIGSDMIQFLEDHLSENNNRILIVETSGSADFAKTRQFYIKNGFKIQATLPDFWAQGDDKVIFLKKLN